MWSRDAEEALQDCFQSNWHLFLEDYKGDIEVLTHHITDHLRFSEDNVVPTKKIRCFLNNKPWITKDIKTLLNRKKMAFMLGDREELRRAENSYKGRLEIKLVPRRCGRG